MAEYVERSSDDSQTLKGVGESERHQLRELDWVDPNIDREHTIQVRRILLEYHQRERHHHELVEVLRGQGR